jgi:hypothetical protein
LLDVHPPQEAPHGVRDFSLHLFTITVGLLIALSLEGLVEWQHHRHLAHEAEARMRAEIASNAEGLPDVAATLKAQQEELRHDVAVLEILQKTGKIPPGSNMSVQFRVVTFASTAWRTAQSSGALSYIPYDEAEEFSDIYTSQTDLKTAQEQAARDSVMAIGLFTDGSIGDPTPAQAALVTDRINTLQGQLILVSSMLDALHAEYQRFLQKK